LLLEFSCTDGAGSYGVFDCVVVVSLELEDKGRATTTGGLTSVFVVSVLLVTLGAAGTVVTVLSDSIVVWHHALLARPTAIPIAAADIHKLRDLISFILLLVKCDSRECGTHFILPLSSWARLHHFRHTQCPSISCPGSTR
jgi:hypothetical protein